MKSGFHPGGKGIRGNFPPPPKKKKEGERRGEREGGRPGEGRARERNVEPEGSNHDIIHRENNRGKREKEYNILHM